MIALTVLLAACAPAATPAPAIATAAPVATDVPVADGRTADHRASHLGPERDTHACAAHVDSHSRSAQPDSGSAHRDGHTSQRRSCPGREDLADQALHRMPRREC